MEESEVTTRSAEDNMKLYMRNYSHRFELPMSFMLAGSFFWKDPRYAFQVMKHVPPSDKSTTRYQPPLIPRYELDDEGCYTVIRLKFKEHSTSAHLTDCGEALLRNLVPKMYCFSDDGSMFAYMTLEAIDGDKENKIKPTKFKRKIYVVYCKKEPRNLINKIRYGSEAKTSKEEQEHFLAVFDDSNLSKMMSQNFRKSN